MAELEGLNRLGDGMTTFDPELEEEDISEADISRWRELFGYSKSEASDAILRARADLNHPRLTNDQWDSVQAGTGAQGHDKESYEHGLLLWMLNRGSKLDSYHKPKVAPSYIFKLGETNFSLETLQRDVGVSAELRRGYDDDGHEADFVRVDGHAKHAIEQWLLQRSMGQRPAFIPLNQAPKDLSDNSSHPTLGIDSTLPQHRANNDNEVFAPAQTEYPVWYFFYGTLTVPQELQRQLHLSDPPSLIPATVKGGNLRTWGRKYMALVDGPVTAQADGWAYRVESSDHEESLRYRETTNYEVVRCRITLRGGKEIPGLTFRYVLSDKLDALGTECDPGTNAYAKLLKHNSDYGDSTP
ncbi:MAG: hypothetical protein Q9166_000189 [cf. Caloplaca sp. 2 TL-2023]